MANRAGAADGMGGANLGKGRASWTSKVAPLLAALFVFQLAFGALRIEAEEPPPDSAAATTLTERDRARRNQRLQLAVFEGAGHGICDERPEEFSKEVLSFLDE